MADEVDDEIEGLRRELNIYRGGVARAHGMLDALGISPGVIGERSSLARLFERIGGLTRVIYLKEEVRRG